MSSAGAASSSASSSRTASTTLRNPDLGSVSPSASLPSLWNYLEPALRHILSGPTNTPGKAPTIDVAYHVGIHTAVYNYFTALSDSPANMVPLKGNGKGKDVGLNGTGLYECLDKLFADTAQEIFLDTPDAALIEYYVPSFIRYSAGIQSVNRVLN